MSICFLFLITKSQKGQNEVKMQDKNVRNLNLIKSDMTKVKNLSCSLIETFYWSKN